MTAPEQPEPMFHVENWRLRGDAGRYYIVGDLNPGRITTSRVVSYNPLQGWAETR